MKVTSLPLNSRGIQLNVYIKATAAVTKIKEKIAFALIEMNPNIIET